MQQLIENCHAAYQRFNELTAVPDRGEHVVAAHEDASAALRYALMDVPRARRSSRSAVSVRASCAPPPRSFCTDVCRFGNGHLRPTVRADETDIVPVWIAIVPFHLLTRKDKGSARR
jgi:hypothetical protein